MDNSTIKKSNKILIGSRASKLALAQANEIKNTLIEHQLFEEDQIEIIKITTSGDKIKNVSLADIGGKGLFIKELEESLIDGVIDIAVHSAKDVPPVVHQDSEIVAFTERNDVRDYFISDRFESIKSLPRKAVVGTSSARRKAILLKMRPDLEIVNFRGNVDTRLKKLGKNEVDATILAVCGLKRIGKDIEYSRAIEPEIMLPSVGQGSIAIQIRKNDDKNRKILSELNHKKSDICVSSERNFLRILRASCRSPISVYCNFEDEILRFRSIIYDFDGQECYKFEDKQNIADKIENIDKNYEDLLKMSLEMSVRAADETRKNALDLLERICR